ncbi:hypothetical protein D3C81_841420 [compost metagenome]
MHRPVGDGFREDFLRLRLAGKGDEVFRQCLVRRAFDHRPVFRIVQALRPDDAQFHAFLLRRSDPAVVGRAHHHVTGHQPLRRLRARLPPLDVRLDLVELGKGPRHALRGFQDLVHVVRLDAVGEQRDFQGVLGALAQAALAREVGDVPEVRPGLRRLGLLALVIGHDHRPDVSGHPAFGQRTGHEVRRITEAPRIELLEQALLAAAQQLGAFDFHHVPAGVTGGNHGLDLRQLAVVLPGDDIARAAGVEGLEVGLILGLFGSTTEGNHGEVLGGRPHTGTQQRQGKRNTATQGSGHGSLPRGLSARCCYGCSDSLK